MIGTLVAPPVTPAAPANDARAPTRDYVVVAVADQEFALPVAVVNEVFAPPPITPVPLAPAAVRGLLNLRGRVVTALDMRTVLSYPPAPDTRDEMAVGCETPGGLYALLVDRIGDVVPVSDAAIERCPPHVDPVWRAMATGVYRAAGRLVVILDISRILDPQAPPARIDAASKDPAP